MKSIDLPLPHNWSAWPRIYEPWTIRGVGSNMPPKFGVSAPVDLFEPDDLIDVRHRNGRVGIHSTRRPEVIVSPGRSIDWLVHELAKRDARNLSRDSLLADHQLRVWFERRPFNLGYIQGIALALQKVQIL